MATQIPGYGGQVPKKATDTKENWATNVYNMIVWIATIFVGKFNTAVTEVETNRSTTQDRADEVVQNTQITLAARDEAVGAVAQLPDGVVNDAITSPTNTWSSEKIAMMKLTEITAIANITAVKNNYITLDSETSGFNVLCPVVHVEGDEFYIYTGEFVGLDLKNVVLNGNGSNLLLLDLVDTDISLDENGVEIKVKSNGTDWRIL